MDLPQPRRTTITVLATQLEALHGLFGEDLSDEDCYSAAAIAVLLSLDARRSKRLFVSADTNTSDSGQRR